MASEGKAQASHPLPPAARFILTRRLPCAALAVLTFTAVLWIPGMTQGVPLLSAILPVLALGLQILTPALFALILLGGGLAFASQVALIASVAAGLLAGMSILVGLLMLTLYAMLPVFSALALGKAGGLERSAQHLAIGLGMAVLLALGFGAIGQGLTLHDFTGQILAPFFEAFANQQMTGVDETAYAEMLVRLRSMVTAIFPGFTALSLWLSWWGNLLLARYLAMHYGFFSGDRRPFAYLRFGRQLAYGLAAALALAALTQGALQYVAGNAAIFMAGIIAVQGLAVAHLWLKMRKMHLVTVLMYLILLIQPAMVLPFVMIGLMDIWFDYRRGNPPVTRGD